MLIFDVPLLLLFAIIAYQDFRQREVSWYLFPITFIVIVLRALSELELYQLYNYFGINLLFITLQIAVLFIVYAIKNKKITNIINRYIGMGDLILFILLCASFSPILFGVFLLTSLILLTISFSIIQKISNIKNGKTTVPLAGGLSVAYIFVTITGIICTRFNVYNDYYIGELIIGK
jgi:hypothetical protein